MGDPRWSGLFLKDYTPWRGPMLEQFLKNCSPWEGPILEKFVKGSVSWEGIHARAGEKCEEEGVSERDCSELTTTPPSPLHHSAGERSWE